MSEKSDRETIAKLAEVPRVLQAATLLHSLGLIDQEPSCIVRKHVKKHPEINQLLNRK